MTITTINSMSVNAFFVILSSFFGKVFIFATSQSTLVLDSDSATVSFLISSSGTVGLTASRGSSLKFAAFGAEVGFSDFYERTRADRQWF
jgi:hypothetical protein